MQGELTLDDVRQFVEKAVLRFGGTFVPDGDFYRIETPSALRNYPNVAARYDTACFQRAIAMRRKNADFMGLGHPLVDAIIAHCSHSSFPGDVTACEMATAGAVCSVRYMTEAILDDGSKRTQYESAQISSDGSWNTATARDDLNLLNGLWGAVATRNRQFPTGEIRARIESAIVDAEARIRSEHLNVQTVRGRVVGFMSGIQIPASTLKDLKQNSADEYDDLCEKLALNLYVDVPHVFTPEEKRALTTKFRRLAQETFAHIFETHVENINVTVELRDGSLKIKLLPKWATVTLIIEFYIRAHDLADHAAKDWKWLMEKWHRVQIEIAKVAEKETRAKAVIPDQELWMDERTWEEIYRVVRRTPPV